MDLPKSFDIGNIVEIENYAALVYEIIEGQLSQFVKAAPVGCEC
jgi:hypothetical protein